jgi:hypothetical protein
MTQLIFERKIAKLEARRDKKGGGGEKKFIRTQSLPLHVHMLDY